MPGVSTGIFGDSNFMNLKAISQNEIRNDIFPMLVNDEQIVSAFMTIRDQVIFTTKRIIVVNVQGITGKKSSFFSYPYSKVQYYGIQTAGVLDIDSELLLAFNNGAMLTFDFKSNVDIRGLSKLIAYYVL